MSDLRNDLVKCRQSLEIGEKRWKVTQAKRMKKNEESDLGKKKNELLILLGIKG